MVTDPVQLQDARDGCEFVCRSRNIAVGNCNAATSVLGFNQAGMRELCFNLLLASTFSVLEQVLRALRDQGAFARKRDQLGALMSSSRTALPWMNWLLVDSGRNDRNQSVHARTYLPHAKCREYIAAIEQELVIWGVLSSARPELWHW